MKIKDHVVGFLTVSLALVVMLMTVSIILTSYRGACEYLKEFNSFNSALSKTIKEENQEEVRTQTASIDFSEFNFEELNKEQLEKIEQEVMTQLGNIQLDEEALRAKKKRKG